MQVRQPTYFEAMLDRLVDPTREYMRQNSAQDPLAVLIAHILREDNTQRNDLAATLANEPLLRAGRAYLGLLLENDRLPRGEQLTLEELTLPRGLLVDFFGGSVDIQTRAQEVLSLVERKFSQRAFKQATILLQLFETDQATRMQNERKLFYEDMIQRLGIRRRHPLTGNEVTQVHEHFKAITDVLRTAGAFNIPPAGQHDPSPKLSQLVRLIESPNYLQAIQTSQAPRTARDPFADEPTMEMGWDDIDAAIDDSTTIQSLHDPFLPLTRSFDWLAARHQINFCLLGRHPHERKVWGAIDQMSTRTLPSDLNRFIPPQRWRPPADLGEQPLAHMLAAHFSDATFREYFNTLTRACYFLLLAVGDTGLEAYLDCYFNWLETTLGVNGTQFIDRLHRESTLGDLTLGESLRSIYDDFLAQPVNALRERVSENDISRSIQSFLRQMTQANFSEIAPGHYDLGALLLDHIVGFEYPTKEFAFKVHRIV